MVNDILKYTEALINIDSPTGYSIDAVNYIETELQSLGADYFKDKKGNIYCEINKDLEQTALVATHLDTLGLMVSSINNDGTLNVTKLGGLNLSTINGAYCKVLCRDGSTITGVIHSKYGSMHVSPEAGDKIELENLIVSLDSKVSSKQEVNDLGIINGAFVFVDPKFEISNGFVKSRFLDDKLCCAISLVLIKQILSNKINITQNVIFAFSTYEEVGHGMANVVRDVDNFITLDMACVGPKLDGDEYRVTVCPKDSSGPYDYVLTNEMIDLCISHKLNYAVDIYPMYGSDGSAALRGGNDIAVCLIGPGVAFSHGVERAHSEGIENTYHLLSKYLSK